MFIVTVAVAVVVMLLPYSPLANVLGFEPLHFTTLLALLGIVAMYFVSAEFTKRWFFKKYG
jgi:Mg2+-importing ATPase